MFDMSSPSSVLMLHSQQPHFPSQFSPFHQSMRKIFEEAWRLLNRINDLPEDFRINFIHIVYIEWQVLIVL